MSSHPISGHSGTFQGSKGKLPPIKGDVSGPLVKYPRRKEAEGGRLYDLLQDDWSRANVYTKLDDENGNIESRPDTPMPWTEPELPTSPRALSKLPVAQKSAGKPQMSVSFAAKSAVISSPVPSTRDTTEDRERVKQEMEKLAEKLKEASAQAPPGVSEGSGSRRSSLSLMGYNISYYDPFYRHSLPPIGGKAPQPHSQHADFLKGQGRIQAQNKEDEASAGYRTGSADSGMQNDFDDFDDSSTYIISRPTPIGDVTPSNDGNVPISAVNVQLQDEIVPGSDGLDPNGNDGETEDKNQARDGFK